eukprot:TRINITY_DN12486_c0_g1_i2.p1 TRINITY_DN12486_c0_g1~~TRINITY_DN12486_c0_g1_i2.p1  ORF type:complete len:228 (+),score=35.24 TRINITY_DN12486_c0_g1_i2:236-919(+)
MAHLQAEYRGMFDERARGSERREIEAAKLYCYRCGNTGHEQSDPGCPYSQKAAPTSPAAPPRKKAFCYKCGLTEKTEVGPDGYFIHKAKLNRDNTDLTHISFEHCAVLKRVPAGGVVQFEGETFLPENLCCATCLCGTQSGEEMFRKQYLKELNYPENREQKVANGQKATAAWKGLAAGEKAQYNNFADEIQMKQDPLNTDYSVYHMSETCSGYGCTHPHPNGVGTR